MEINSPYHDYYDFVGHIHGRDTKHTYVRRHFENPHMASDIRHSLTFAVNTDVRLGLESMTTRGQRYSAHYWGGVGLGERYYRTQDDRGNPLDKETIQNNARRVSMYDTQWIAVAGKIYRVFGRQGLHFTERETEQRKRGAWPEDDPKAYTLLSPSHPVWEYLSDDSRVRYSGPVDCPALLPLHRKLQAPVFHILDSGGVPGKAQYSYVIPYRLPILQEHGFADVVDPYQMYQDLEYFIANTMNESPDMMPPTEMTDKERIVAAGFDLKQSFRHRK